MVVTVTSANRHLPVFSIEQMEKAYEQGRYEEAVRMLVFNRQHPSRRLWHHHVHQQFGLPCDALCEPRKKYKGTDLIERIKDAYRIEDIASKHTRLRGSHTLSGPCFLHGGSGSEFVVWVDDQKFKCFGRCGIHGDVVDLVRAMKERGLEWQTEPTIGVVTKPTDLTT